MSFHQGKKAREAYEAFNKQAFDEKGQPKLARMARVLERRPLGDKHIAEALAFYTDLQKAATLKIHSEFSDKAQARQSERVINLSLLYLALGVNQYGDVANDRYVPVTLSSTVKQDHVSYFVRALPVTFASRHVEERFGYWMRKDLQYATDAFMDTAMTSLAMIRPLENIMVRKHTNELPVSLPHEDGFFLGFISVSHPTNFLFIPGFVARLKGDNGQPDIRGLDGKTLLPEWAPSSAITIRTFVPRKTLSPDQCALHDAFTKITGGSNGRRSLGINLAGYTSGAYSKAQDAAILLRSLDHKLSDLMNSQLWERAHANSLRHLPSEQLAAPQQSPK